MKEFFKEHSHLELSLQHISVGPFKGCWRIRIYNKTWDPTRTDPVFEHYVTDELIERCVLDFETVIMTPILNWWEEES